MRDYSRIVDPTPSHYGRKFSDGEGDAVPFRLAKGKSFRIKAT